MRRITNTAAVFVLRIGQVLMAQSTYSTSSGIPLSVTYVDFLRRVVPGPVRLRTTDGMSPVVIVSGDQPVGVLMPVRL